MKRCLLLLLAFVVFSGCGQSDTNQDSQPQSSGENQTAGETQAASNSQSATPAEGFDSPEAVFAALKQAAEKDDFPAAIRCMDPESQEMMAVVMTLPLAFMSIDPEKGKEITELLSKHGISLEDDSEEFPIKTTEARIAYISDVMEWLDKNSEEAEEGPINKLVDASLGEVTLDGDSAHAVVTLADNQTEPMDFKRVDGKWFAHLVDPSMGPGREMHAGDLDPFGGFGDEERPPVPLEAVTSEQFNSAWQVSLDVQDQSALEQLKKLTEELGLELVADPDLEAALQKPVSLKVDGKSRLEAIEQIARQLELTPVYAAGAVSFEPGQRALPIVFSGPFLIAVTGFDTRPGTATGLLSLQAYTTGVPPAVLTLLNEGFSNHVDFTSISDKAGQDLTRGYDSGSVWGGSGTALAFDHQVTIGLKNLLRGVETIATLEGFVSFNLPTKVEVIKFDELKPGTEKQAGEFTIKLTEIDNGSYTFEFSGAESDDVQLLAYDAEGKQLMSFGRSSFGGGDGGSINENFQDTQPARYEVRVATELEPLTFDFKFVDVPVPNHDEMPEQLAELKFEGDAPFSLKFDSFTGEENFKQIKFKITNHTNKDAESVSLNIDYLDADGKKLDDAPSTYSRDVIPAGKSIDIEVSAFFMPEGSKTATATVRSVEFTDATSWEAEE